MYNDGTNNKTLTTGNIAAYGLNTSGQYVWFYGTGTTGTNSTLTQAMTLDASGNLAIGTTTAYGRLDVAVSTGSGVGSTTTLNISSGNEYGIAGNEKYLNLDFLGYRDGAGSNGIKARIQAIEATGTDRASGLYFYTTPTSGVLTQRAVIDSSGNLGIGTSSPSASAILDAQSTTKGVRMPNMTTTQKNAISSPAAGLMVFDTTLAKLCVYSGSAWQTITSV
jgi:hypothetical protein